MRVALRRAEIEDVPFVTALVSHAEIAPFLAAVRAGTEEEVRTEVERALAEPDAHGVHVIEVDGRPVGTVAWERVNRRSRIASVGGLAVDPGTRGGGVATAALRELVSHLLVEKGFHRVQLEVYAFNERALALFERAGFTREGVRRKAYRRHGAWVDGILFGLVEEDLRER